MSGQEHSKSAKLGKLDPFDHDQKPWHIDQLGVKPLDHCGKYIRHLAKSGPTRVSQVATVGQNRLMDYTQTTMPA